MSFYNTIKEKDKESLDKMTRTQEEWVYWIFKEFRGRYTPFEIQEILYKFGKTYPITSVRRSLTDLTSKGKLIKTDTMKRGKYNMKNYTWKLNTEPTLF